MWIKKSQCKRRSSGDDGKLSLDILEVKSEQWDNSGIAWWVWEFLYFESGDCRHECAETVERDFSGA